MKPNWSALAAVFRTLTILGASTFVGAVVLPLSTTGTLPLEWSAWRPVLAVALSAAVVAEFIWIRSHLAALAAAAGLSTPGTTVSQTTTTVAHVDPSPAPPTT